MFKVSRNKNRNVTVKVACTSMRWAVVTVSCLLLRNFISICTEMRWVVVTVSCLLLRKFISICTRMRWVVVTVSCLLSRNCQEETLFLMHQSSLIPGKEKFGLYTCKCFYVKLRMKYIFFLFTEILVDLQVIFGPWIRKICHFLDLSWIFNKKLI